jgi:Kef-type K+ transport system membrane component KefB
MVRTGALLLLFVLVVVARLAAVSTPGWDTAADATLALGFVLIVSYFAGRFVAACGIPSITGYILVGVMFGPHVLSGITPALAVLSPENVAGLRLLDGAALGLIALTAGGELNLRIVRRRGRAILYVVAGQLVVVGLGIAALTFAAHHWIPGLAELSAPSVLAASLLLGVTATANSPATTIAVIQEYQARGPVTQLGLAVTVVKDVVVVVVFTVVLALAVRLAGGNGDHGTVGFATVLLELTWEVLGSLVLGVVVGWLIRLYGRRVGGELPLLVLAIAFLSGALSEQVRLSGLLVCMVAGFYVENFSAQGDALIDAVERHSLPLYVVFFTMAGADIDMPILRQMWVLALVLVLTRGLLTYTGTYLGARLARELPSVRRHGWSSFIGQAGVTLGFVALIANRIPSFGSSLATVIVAGIALNQLLGPVIFRLGLSAAHEIPRRDADGARRTAPPLRRLSTRELTRASWDE